MHMMNLDEIADQIIEGFDLNERVRIANMPSSDLEIVEAVLADYVVEKVREICHEHIDEYASGEMLESMEIVKRVWERLRETHKLKVVK